ncbi:MAG: tRNA (N(6)-L-threonylcarbamoyladenosine(37)-C(2))-methylthiotransferase MtaB [Leptospiraceae bacterium]|nr:tRNA (N(6)-L-threonylcarbamoyladenosine(37)-C(2))-methylthiotransferase MtaB [Leptospiraceae bacterium]
MKKTIGFITLGCRLNIFESDGLASSMQKEGFEVVSPSLKPEIIVINTCTVTNKADSKNRNIIRKAIRDNPSSQVWVTGCYAQTDKEAIQSIPGVKGVIGNDEKASLPYKILENYGNNNSKEPGIFDRFAYSNVLPNNHTRAYLKVQDGCNRKCSYCKIPSARGGGVSRNFEDVLAQIKFLQENGIAEIILTGVNLGWYRDNQKKFHQLLEAILNCLTYSRLRLSSIEPTDVDISLANSMQHPRFCNYLHVPLQSGSNKILKKMHRNYRIESYVKRISIIKKCNPNVFLGTDVITGFPGETKEDFKETLYVLKSLEIAKIHAFPFSPRLGTEAATLKNTVSPEEKKERINILQKLSLNQSYVYGLKQIGKNFESVLENNGVCTTDNFLKVKVNAESRTDLKVGQFLNVKISDIHKTDKEVFFSGTI